MNLLLEAGLRCIGIVGVLAIVGTTALAQQGANAPSAPTPAGNAPIVQGGGVIKAATKPGENRLHTSRHNRRVAKKYFLKGASAFGKDDLRGAEGYFLKARKLDPDDPRYAASVEIAKQYEVRQLVNRAGQERSQGQSVGSLETIRRAMSLDPRNPLITQYKDEQRANSLAELPEVHSDAITANAPVRLIPSAVLHGFHLRAGEGDLIHQVLNAYGIDATVDQSVDDKIVSFDATEVTFSEAARLLQLATDTFFVPLDTRHLLAVADTKQNRAKYERQILETVSFPGFSPGEINNMGNIAHNVLGIQSTYLHPLLRSITIRAPEAELRALNHIYSDLLAGRSEVRLDMDIYEIDRTNETDAGVILPSSASLFNLRSEANNVLANNASLVQEIIESGLASAGDWQKIIAILISYGELSGTVFNNPFVVFGGGLTETGMEWNSTAANMLLDSSEVTLLKEVQLCVLEQEEVTFRDGERYPIITGTFSSSTGVLGTATNTTPEFQYTDLGLTLKVRPYIEGNTDITLHISLQLDALAGSTLNDIPILSNRQYAGVVSVHPGDSALLVSAISKQDSMELTGVPGLSDIPGFESTTNRQEQNNNMELVILITPHIVREVHREAVGPMLWLPMH